MIIEFAYRQVPGINWQRTKRAKQLRKKTLKAEENFPANTDLANLTYRVMGSRTCNTGHQKRTCQIIANNLELIFEKPRCTILTFIVEMDTLMR